MGEEQKCRRCGIDVGEYYHTILEEGVLHPFCNKCAQKKMWMRDKEKEEVRGSGW